MSHLQYFSYPGFGDRVRKDTHYAQAVRIDNRIEISGQGGWDPKTEEISADVNTQIDQAFANVELTLKNAGGKGWEHVYKVRAYFTEMNDESMGAYVRNVRKYCPDHTPLLTGVLVKGLYAGMVLELEAEAHSG
ncbi:putative translation initiation inhibitor [Lophiotrema nucula]|uniref:Putative translation initiation inhibitor n=1 Tax=Lophiotrema nucula TaxID=690887 RepID=A0A6A5ZXW6_9PLEO|nr:putative translation initiation inhibitor [Lophiotrema nucula]